MGIAPEELDNLFVAFTQAQAGRDKQEGTGLGLVISRQFVQLGKELIDNPTNKQRILSLAPD